MHLLCNKLKGGVALAAALLLTPLTASASPVLFSIQEVGAVAERLPYGPSAITPASTPFFSTLDANVLSSTWYSQGVDGLGAVLYDIQWDFTSGPKSIAQRFADAVVTPEGVNWTVTSALSGVQTYAGTWQFSDSSGVTLSTFTGSGTRFSSDDGIWGAGNGLINGNGGGAPGNTAWGFGNFNSSDGSAKLVLDGVNTAVPSGFRNYVFYENGLGGAPELDTAAGTLPLLFVGCFLTVSGSRRRKQAQTL